MIGKTVIFAGIAVMVVATTVWYVMLRVFLRKNDGKKAGEVEPAVKKYMTVLRIIGIVFFVSVLTGAILTNYGI